MALIEAAMASQRWGEDGYVLVQEFRLRLPLSPPDAASIVRQADALVMARTRATGFGLTRWDGSHLMLGRIRVLSLGPLEPQSLPGFSAAAQRAILGGLAARRPGGSIWYRVCEPGDALVIVAGLSGFCPRLPRFAHWMIQAPLHRATIRRAIRDLAAGIDATPDS